MKNQKNNQPFTSPLHCWCHAANARLGFHTLRRPLGGPALSSPLCSWPPVKASEGGAAQPCCQPSPTPRGQNEAQNLNLQSGKLRVFVLLTGAVERAAKEDQEGEEVSAQVLHSDNRAGQ